MNLCLTKPSDDEAIGARELKNQPANNIVSVSVVRVMLVSVNSDQISKEKILY